MSEERPLVGVIMGSKSDWDTMAETDRVLTDFGIPHECQVVSAHRTPAWMAEYASTAAGRGLQVIGVPVKSAALGGLDSLLSIVQMPKGVPVATVAIGSSGAVNAGLLAVAILATSRPDLRAKLQQYRDEMAGEVRGQSL